MKSIRRFANEHFDLYKLCCAMPVYIGIAHLIQMQIKCTIPQRTGIAHLFVSLVFCGIAQFICCITYYNIVAFIYSIL